MDKIYITNTLFDFKTRIFPKNAIIINLEKYNKSDFLKDIFTKIGISNIICENKTLYKYISNKFPNYNVSLVEDSENTCFYKDKTITFFLYFILLSSFTTYFIMTTGTRKYSFLIGLVLLVNILMWLISFQLLIRKQPWENVIVEN